MALLPNLYWDKILIVKNNCRKKGWQPAMVNINFCLILLTPLLVIISMFGQMNKIESYSQSTVLRLKRCEAMSFDLLDITWTTWCCRWALGIRNIEASKMHHDESWWQRSPKNLEPVLHQAGGANLWGWGGPGANIQVALQQLACYSPFFEDTTNKNVKLSNDFNLFSLNVLFAKWMIKFAVKNSKTDEKQVDSAFWFSGETGW